MNDGEEEDEEEFEEDELGFLRFLNCARYRLGATNDEGWYRGHCRFSQVAPEWGEFYEVAGDSTLEGPIDWHVLSEKTANQLHHFLFYLRDHTFECLAEDCMVEPRDDNALHRTRKLIPPFK